MKKYFSITLLLAVVLTFVSTVPAHAAANMNYLDSLAGDDYPYLYYDFNTEFSSSGTANDASTISRAEGEGIGGTDALLITHSMDGNHGLLNPYFLDQGIILDSAYKLSGWIRFDKALKLDAEGNTIGTYTLNSAGQAFTVAIEYKGTNASGGLQDSWQTNYVKQTIPNFNDGKWHYIEKQFPGGALNARGVTYFKNPDRIPNLQFILSHSQDGKNAAKLEELLTGYTAGTSKAKLSWYMDDLIYEPVVAANAPAGSVPVVSAISAPSSNIAGETATFSWIHTPSDAAITGETVTASKVIVRTLVKVTPDSEYADEGWALIDQKYVTGNSFDYEIPADMVGKEVKFEIFPYDETNAAVSGYIPGRIQTVSLGTIVKSEVITPTLDAFVPNMDGSGSITLNLTAVNNKVNAPGNELNLFAILAIYDNSGALIDCKVQDIPSINGGASLPLANQNYTFTLNTEEYTATASAKAFIWGGDGFVPDAAYTAYHTVLSQTK